MFNFLRKTLIGDSSSRNRDNDLGSFGQRYDAESYTRADEDPPVSNFVFNNLKEIMDMENNMYEELSQYGRTHRRDSSENVIEPYNNNILYKDGSENTICSNSSSFIYQKRAIVTPQKHVIGTTTLTANTTDSTTDVKNATDSKSFRPRQYPETLPVMEFKPVDRNECELNVRHWLRFIFGTARSFNDIKKFMTSTVNGPVTMNEYKYLTMIDRVLNHGTRFGLCIYDVPSVNRKIERRVWFDISDFKIIVMSTAYGRDERRPAPDGHGCGGAIEDIESVLESDAFLRTCDTIVDTFSTTLACGKSSVIPDLIFRYKTSVSGSDGFDNCRPVADDGGGGDDYLSGSMIIRIYMKTVSATCVPESDVLLSPDADGEIKYLRARVVKNFVDIDKEMRLDLLRVSLLLHLSAIRIKNRIVTCETENKNLNYKQYIYIL
ncbi:unnamed protein product [Macrosiphum euphorbiae]|uniref:Uncharacterized protein n=1 Tax=Macrosiphum euphorbiae TaxID=13131 RepID=A0AAV0WHH6_9HEMI|nr:unnamed protein product [Macrosiphum euphorbiae]